MVFIQRSSFDIRKDVVLLARDLHIEEAKEKASTLTGHNAEIGWGAIAVGIALRGQDGAKEKAMEAIEHIRNSIFKTNMFRYIALAFASSQQLEIAREVVLEKFEKKISKIDIVLSQLELAAKNIDPRSLKDRVQRHQYPLKYRTSNVVTWKEDFFHSMRQEVHLIKARTGFNC